MNNTLKAELRMVKAKYSEEQIRLGFISYDPVICRMLRHLGELALYPRDPENFAEHICEWEGYESVRGK